MEGKSDWLPQENSVEETDEALLERLWADRPGAVSWKRKSPFGQPVTAVAPIPPAAPAAPRVETVPEPSAPVQAAPTVVEAPQPPVVQPPEPKPEPVMKTEVKPAKQGGLWGTKSRTPVIGGAVPGGVFGSVDSRRTEKERPASLWRKEKEPAAGNEYGRASGSVWAKHTGQGSKTPTAGDTTWGKKVPSAGQICPQCGTPNPADARFCCMCRASLQEKTCPSCGKVIALAQARYCPFCGADL